MSFYVADAVTGRNLIEGQPVVGFIVNHQNGHYPLKQNPNSLGNVPAHYFAVESLPIFGTVADCGRLEVSDASQLSVRLALKMTGTPTWSEASKKAFNDHHGVQFMGKPREGAEQGPQGSDRRVYGLCLLPDLRGKHPSFRAVMDSAEAEGFLLLNL